MRQYCKGGTYIINIIESHLNEEKRNTGWNQIKRTRNNFCHPAHDDKQQLLQQQQHYCNTHRSSSGDSSTRYIKTHARYRYIIPGASYSIIMVPGVSGPRGIIIQAGSD